MGMLEMAGALGGIGKGIEKNVDFERQKQMQSLEDAKEMRIRQFEAEQAAKRQTAGFGHEDTSQASAQTFAAGQQKAGFGEQEKIQGSTQKFEGGEHAKDRASREKIAGISAAAKGAAAKDAATKKRWESKVVKNTSTGPGGIINENEEIRMVDKNTGRTYVQEGSKFFPQGAPRTRQMPGTGKEKRPTEGPIRDAARGEVQKLIENPEQADNFVRTYGYLPYEFFNSAGTSAPDATDTSTQSDDDTPAE